MHTENEGAAVLLQLLLLLLQPPDEKEKKTLFSFSFFQLIPHASSSAPVILASTHAALRG